LKAVGSPSSRAGTHSMLRSWIIAGSMKRLRDALRASVFSPPPLKFRTAGFPQYGFKWVVDGDLRRRTDLYALPAWLMSPVAPRRMCGGDLSQTHPSRGPWLAQRLCCPPESSLTMASSEPLAAAHRLICFVRRALRPRVGPQFKRRVCSCMPSPAPRWIVRKHATASLPPAMVFAISAEARHPHPPRAMVPAWAV